MEPIRMPLAEAAKLLGIAPNSVRSRWKAGKIRGERDNTGKVWVWISAQEQDQSKPSKKLRQKPSLDGEIAALQAHVQTLTAQLALAQAERDALTSRASAADRLEGEKAGLEALTAQVSADRDHWREEALRLGRRWWHFGRR